MGFLMSLSPFSQARSYSVKTTVVVEQIYNALTAMSLLTTPNLDAEAEPWIAALSAKLTPAQQATNRLIFEWFGNGLIPRANQNNLGNLLTAIESESPSKLRDRILQSWLDRVPATDETPRSILADQQRFFAFAEVAFAENPSNGSELDREELAEVQELLTNPNAMQELIVTHLRTLWADHFADEWAKKAAMMRYCTEELNARDWPTESAMAALQAFIRTAIPADITAQLTGVRQINVVPSPFVQLQAARFDQQQVADQQSIHAQSTLWLFMQADFWQLPMRTEPIKRSEVKGPASALADETRLQILEMLAAHEELRAQEIIARLESSQSTVSRHLKQLNSAQFITEKRAGDANKIYRLNRARVGEFSHALSKLLSVENARMVLNDIRLDQPPELHPYLNRDGLVTQWPAKKKGQARDAILDYLTNKFEIGEKLTEKQVNELLNRWHTYDDPAYLRRALVDTGRLERTSDGRQYWKVG